MHGTHLTRSRDLNLYPSELTQGTVAGGSTIAYWRHPDGFGTPQRANPGFGPTQKGGSGRSPGAHK